MASKQERAEAIDQAFAAAGGYRLAPMSNERLALAVTVAEAVDRFMPLDEDEGEPDQEDADGVNR